MRMSTVCIRLGTYQVANFSRVNFFVNTFMLAQQLSSLLILWKVESLGTTHGASSSPNIDTRMKDYGYNRPLFLAGFSRYSFRLLAAVTFCEVVFTQTRYDTIHDTSCLVCSQVDVLPNKIAQLHLAQKSNFNHLRHLKT